MCNEFSFTNLTESLAHEAKELLICSLLGAAVNDHVAELRLLARLNLQLQKLVHLGKKTRLTREIQERGKMIRYEASPPPQSRARIES